MRQQSTAQLEPSGPACYLLHTRPAAWGSPPARKDSKEHILIFVLKSVCPQRNLRYRPPRGSLGLREKQ